MGFYIFDSDQVGPKGKLAMLRDLPGAVPLIDAPASTEIIKKTGKYPVCWMDNQIFEAVGIAIDDHELRRFVTGMAGRDHVWYLVPTEELVRLKPHLAEYLRGERSWSE